MEQFWTRVLSKLPRSRNGTRPTCTRRLHSFHRTHLGQVGSSGAGSDGRMAPAASGAARWSVSRRSRLQATHRRKSGRPSAPSKQCSTPSTHNFVYPLSPRAVAEKNACGVGESAFRNNDFGQILSILSSTYYASGAHQGRLCIWPPTLLYTCACTKHNYLCILYAHAGGIRESISSRPFG